MKHAYGRDGYMTSYDTFILGLFFSPFSLHGAVAFVDRKVCIINTNNNMSEKTLSDSSKEYYGVLQNLNL